MKRYNIEIKKWKAMLNNKILNLFYQKPTIIFLILAFSIYLDTSGFAIVVIELKKTESFELIVEITKLIKYS